MKAAESPPSVALLLFGDRRLPGPLTGLPAQRAAGPADTNAIDAVIAVCHRLVVVGADADLAAVLTRLLRAERLDIEVAYAPSRRTPA
ncbi:MAG: peptidase M50, partial [Mycobacterium sp.]